MIFDAHTHVYPDSPGFWKAPSSAAQLVAAMDDAGVAKAAVIAIAPVIPVTVVEAAAAAYPTRLVAIGSVDPLAPGALEEIDRQVRDCGVRAIKLHPRLQQITFEALPSLTAVARKCGDLGVPLFICSFLGGRELFRGRTLEWCQELAVAARDTAIVLAHAGGHRPIDALLLLKAQPNIHVDLSFSPLYYAGSSVELDFRYFVKKADPQRVLFGSDFPEMPLQASLDWVNAAAESLGLSANHRDLILGGNAVRLLGVH